MQKLNNNLLFRPAPWPALFPAVPVVNVDTGEKLEFACTPREAVMAAYAREHHDFEPLGYEARYGGLVKAGQHTVYLGSWSTFDCRCHCLSL